MRAVTSVLVASLGLFLLNGCGGDDAGGADAGGAVDLGATDFGPGADLGSDPGDAATGVDGATPTDLGPGTPITEDGGFTWTCRIASCGGRVTECGDCVDNDSDGVVDERDPECLGPCDNTEGPALTAGVGGETGGPCVADCYFDFGNGPGNDDCVWDHRCDPLAVSPSYPPEGSACPFDASRLGGRTCPASQSEMCLDVCRPLTPNGCDCFGCCTFDAIAGRSAAEGGEYVWLGSVFEGTNEGSCTLDVVRDTALCKPCTPVADCLNDCGRCELCVGRDPATLPPDCFPPPPPPPPVDGGTPVDGGSTSGDMGPPPPPPPPRCDPGVQVCGLPGEPPCPADTYCVTGCCVPTII
jgi:hypothetical protein